jgi:CRISPR-associated endonuclease/helicase Cas3
MAATPIAFKDFFQAALRSMQDHEPPKPYPWQQAAAEGPLPALVDVPAGLGKTEGIVLAWAYRRLVLRDEMEPRHLVYCLPMRVLVRQTEGRLRACFANLVSAGVLTAAPVVHVMLGGDIQQGWAERPEEPWVLIGTQDQLLSRALNRGYAMSRFQWPVHFGLLNNDCRWVVDEVQLMGPGLWTTAQLDWMRSKRFRTLFGCPTTWMSATIDTSFLESRDRRDAGMVVPAPFGITKADEGKAGPRLQAKRPIRELRLPVERGRAEPIEQIIARRVVEEHTPGTLSLVVCNTVATAQAIFRAIGAPTSKILLTSRFRPRDRSPSEERLYSFEHERREAAARGEHVAGDGLICVSTQVVEAGVDVSAHRLWFEAASWPAIIQRLGRLNRDGLDDEACAHYWVAPRHGRDRAGGPYDADDLEDGLKLLCELARLSDARPARDAIQQVRSGQHAKLARKALVPKPAPLARATDVYALFSTDPDVHGGFTDVSQFVRGTDADADVTVFWRSWEGPGAAAPKDLVGPAFEDREGCPVTVGALKAHLQQTKFTPFTWNERAARWDRLRPDDVRPGMLVLLRSEAGGYSPAFGWTGHVEDRLAESPAPGPLRAEEDEVRSETGAWVGLDTHLSDARREADALVKAAGLPPCLARAVVEAAALHDLGKAHPKWQEKLPPTARQDGPFAKTPYQLRVELSAGAHARTLTSFFSARAVAARCVSTSEIAGGTGHRYALSRELSRAELIELRRLAGVRHAARVPLRPGMRHEAASVLAMWAEHRAGSGLFPALSVYLVACHHGKIRTYLRAWSLDGDDVCGVPPEPGAFVFQGQRMMDFVVAADGLAGEWRSNEFLPMDHGWTALVHDLLGPLDPGEPSTLGAVPDHEPRGLGPFALAYLEALVRIADWRASASPSSSVSP